ncbi:FmRP interacting protein like [Cryptosporidium canis]|uniref:FmRP interacting protein like n=1 Tax=Cryptosporidium canis TaxID=195482 RepID=A0A9D5DGQ1_9CRYT|nr:FmRP interacting protein like [Cryptosporidium canis]
MANISDSQNKKLRKLSNYCDVCGKGFINNDKYLCHISNVHITCNEENCNYSAPKEIMYYHKLKHINNNDGYNITESIEEIGKWLNCRRIKFPRSNSSNRDDSFYGYDLNEIHIRDKIQIPCTQVSALEHYIRSNMNKHELFKNLDKSKGNNNQRNERLPSSNRKRKRATTNRGGNIKPLLFKLFENEIFIYEKKIVLSINYILNSSLYRKYLN